VLDELLVDRVRDEGERLARQPELGAERAGEGLGRERREEVPLDVVEEVMVGDLDVDLSSVKQDLR
jgi:plasmid stabilization system protein ParE